MKKCVSKYRYVVLLSILALVSCSDGNDAVDNPGAKQVVSADWKPGQFYFPYPDFAPLYPGALVIDAREIGFDLGHQNDVLMLTSDSAAKVVAFYQQSIAAAHQPMTQTQKGTMYLFQTPAENQAAKEKLWVIEVSPGSEGRTQIHIKVTVPD
jgi:ABC-type Fe3+-hydroxamate transport system substrate-binding protein